MSAVIKSIRTWKDDFWDQVVKHAMIPDAESTCPACDEWGRLCPSCSFGPCWEWKGQRDRDGYGVFNKDGKHLRANIVGYEIQNGPIPDGHFVMHKCDNPPCVRGSHLRTGTNAQNLADMAAKGRARGGRKTK